MSFLLDINVVSEWGKARPNRGVVAWLAQADEDRVFLSVATLAELRNAIERLPAGRRRARLGGWLREELPIRFAATARVRGLTLVTRNEADFERTVDAILNPWTAN